MNARVEKLRQQLEEPLIVTTPANVRYLTGFVSSNVSLVVDSEQVRLFTDFRYAEAARAVPDVEFVQTLRETVTDMAEMLTGTFGFESPHLTYAQYCVAVASSSFRAPASSRGCARSRTTMSSRRSVGQPGSPTRPTSSWRRNVSSAARSVSSPGA